MTRVLLVTGARSLADSPDAERWARALIASALADCDLLIVGDADGPDAWAWEIAAPTVREQRRYCVRGDHAGDVRVRYIARSVADARWATWRWSALGVYPHPLARNAAMVADAACVAERRHGTVSVLALLDGRKPAVTQPGEKRPTRGTEHTARLARAAGLSVREERWPPAPKGTP